MQVYLLVKVTEFGRCLWVHTCLRVERNALLERYLVFSVRRQVLFDQQSQPQPFTGYFLALVNFNHGVQLVLELVILKPHVFTASLVVVDREVVVIHLLLEFAIRQRIVVLPKLHRDLVSCKILLKKLVVLVVRL